MAGNQTVRPSIYNEGGALKSLVFDPTKESREDAARRLRLPAQWLIPDTRQPGAMEALGYEEWGEIDGEMWYCRK